MLNRWWTFGILIVTLLYTGPVQAEDGPNFFPTEVGMTWTYGGNPREMDALPEPGPMPVIPKDDYFPTAVGLTWTFSGSPFKETRLVRMLGVERSAVPLTYFWDGFLADRRVRKAEDGKVMEIRNGKERLLFDLGAGVGTSWSIEPVDEGGDLLDGSTATVLSRSAELKVPYGSFEQCIHLGFKPAPGLADAGVLEAWFAPGLGLIKWVEQSIAGPKTLELVAFINRSLPDVVISSGEPVPTPVPDPMRPIEDYANRMQVEKNGVRYEVATFKAEYAQDEKVEMQYQVTALDGEAQFQFTSTQQIDFLLVDGQNTKAWVWSDGRGFGDALTSFTLKPGESRQFVEVLNLERVAISGGSYRLIGVLPTRAFEGETVPREQTEVSVELKVTGDPVRAQLTGVVVGEDGGPVMGAIVSARREVRLLPGTHIGTEPVSATRTDAEGKFIFGGLRPGDYVVTANLEGHLSAYKALSLTAGSHGIRLVIRRVDPDYPNVHLIHNDRFVAELATDQVAYMPGDSIRVRYRLTNTGEDALSLSFSSGQRYDLALDGPQGRVWLWSEEMSFIQVLGSEPLGAGETYTVTDVFPVLDTWPEGGYLLTGFLTLGDGNVKRVETEGMVKLRLGQGGVVPPPGRPERVMVSLETDRVLYAPGDTAHVTYRLENVSGDSLHLTFPSGQRYDLVLEGPYGPFWGWSWTRSFIAATGELTLAPRDMFTFREPAPLSVGLEGTYVFRAWMVVRGEKGLLQDETQSRVKFRVGAKSSEGGPDPPVGPPGQDTTQNLKRSGDFNADGLVNFVDFLNFAAAFGKRSGSEAFDEAFDLDGDTEVGFGDFLIFASVFGK